MIKIERGSPPAEILLWTRKKKESFRKLGNLVVSGELKSTNFKFEHYGPPSPEVKEFLYKSQHGKCCYCERKRGKKEFHVEHFRPKAKVKGDQKIPSSVTGGLPITGRTYL